MKGKNFTNIILENNQENKEIWRKFILSLFKGEYEIIFT